MFDRPAGTAPWQLEKLASLTNGVARLSGGGHIPQDKIFSTRPQSAGASIGPPEITYLIGKIHNRRKVAITGCRNRLGSKRG